MNQLSVPLHAFEHRLISENSIAPLVVNAQQYISMMTATWYDDFERQRRNIGIGELTRRSVIEQTKKGIHALKDGKLDEVNHYLAEAKRQYDESLVELNVPLDQRWEFMSDAGGELIEFYYFVHYAYILFGYMPTEMPHFAQFNVSPQAYLAGLADVPGELTRLLSDIFAEYEVTTYQKYQLRMNLIEISKSLYAKLDEFATCYGRVIDNSRRRDWGSRYRAVIGRVRRIIDTQQQIVEEMKHILNMEFLLVEQRKLAVQQEVRMNALSAVVMQLSDQLASAGYPAHLTALVPQNAQYVPQP